ncbi:unnamed protein product [Paramecium primaurelia]|uniref:BART domain-containing protein n=1 Tax=Paramecium primaurelia TaxID=5886 RepID=A0A8S1MN22_PARPR|nr:unnamed protein product [Paramecium primaurelia]
MVFLTYFFSNNKKGLNYKQNDEEIWIYDLVYEHLTSPIWKIAIMEFIDENCIIFDDEDQYTPEQEQKFQQFKELISSQFDNMLNEYGLTNELLTKQIIIGLAHPQHKNIFQQIIAINDYKIFRKQMINRNKELELEALEELEKQDRILIQQQQKMNIQQPAQEFDQQFELKRLQIEKEKTELELAIELSKKAEEEQKRLMETQNDEFLKKILEQSLQEFNELQKKLENVQKRESELKSQPQYRQSEIFKSIKNVKYPSFTSYTQRQEERYNQNHLHQDQGQFDSHILHQQDFQNQDHQPQLIRDYSFKPPVIERVSSELLEESAILSNEAMHDQKLKMQQQKDIIIKKKNEINKSELLKFEQDKKPVAINKTYYQQK